NLVRAGIEVGVAGAPFRSTAAHSFMDERTSAAHEFPAGAFVIDLAQPQKRLAKALLEPHTEQDAAFIREQLARFARNERRGRSAPQEDYGFYDITAWSLPLAFNVEAYWTEDATSLRVTPVALSTLPVQMFLSARVIEEQANISANVSAPMSNKAASNGEVSSLDPRFASLLGGVSGRAQVAYIIPY